jgi:hypothetical protein
LFASSSTLGEETPQLPYDPVLQFERQQQSLCEQWYPKRQVQHSRYAHRQIFQGLDAANLIQGAATPWIQAAAGVTQINTAGIHPELEEAIQRFGGILEGIIFYRRRFIDQSAVATVLYDNHTDRLYYGISGYYPGLLQLPVHATLTARIAQLPMIQGPNHVQVHSAVRGGRAPDVCSEFKALNMALQDGAQEVNLSCWAFRILQMTPMPQCANCRVTVDRATLGRVWTG